MNNPVSEHPRSPYLIEQIEKMMLFIAQVDDINLLTRRRIPKAFGFTLQRQPFIDLCSPVRKHPTPLRYIAIK